MVNVGFQILTAASASETSVANREDGRRQASICFVSKYCEDYRDLKGSVFMNMWEMLMAPGIRIPNFSNMKTSAMAHSI